MTDSWRAKIDWHVRHYLRQALLYVVGRELICTECGRRLFRAIPIVWRGRVKLLGASEVSVRVEFSEPNTLEFRHVMLDQCPTRERPWAA